MSSKNLQFLKFVPDYFAGINSEKAKDLIVVFPDKDTRIVELTCDQGGCKTSLLQFIKAISGGTLPQNAINSIDQNMGGTSEFTIDDVLHTVRMTKTGFTIKKTIDGIKHTVSSPKEYLEKEIGNIGMSPMVLKEMKGETAGRQQIEWLREVCKLTPDQMKLETRIKTGYQTAYDKRTEVNREYSRLQKELIATGYYVWDNENKVVITTELLKTDTLEVDKNNFNDDEIKQKYDLADKKVKQYIAAEDTLNKLEEAQLDVISEIDELQKKLAAAELKRIAIEDRIKSGNQWLIDNPNPQKDLDDVLILMKNSGVIQNKKSAIESSKEKLGEFLKTETDKINLEAEIEEYKDRQKEFVKATTPEIEGLEIVVGNWHPDKAEGIYYYGKTPAQLSESESWELFLKLCQALDVKVAIIENISSLGSAAIEIINQFTASGGYVFASKMDRSQKDIVISYHHKYDA